MQDEQHRALDDRVIDDERSFAADDAVSNRSDDTALDETNGAQSSGPHASGPGQMGDEPNRFDTQPESAEEGHADQPADGEAAEQETAAAVGDEEAENEPLEESGAAKPVPAAAKPAAVEELPEEEIRMDWYILKVQSNRERSIAEALERKIRIEGLDRYFDQVIVPTEKVTEFKGGKKKVVERKLYPGYIVVHMHINDDTWFAVRETSGVGDFTGAGGKPTPMLPHEVTRIIQTEEEETSEAPKLDIKFSSGDKVKVKEGNFENFEGEVNTIDEASGRVTVMINIFGRSTPVELEYWQIEAV